MTEDLANKAKRIFVILLNSLYEYGTMPKTVFLNYLTSKFYQFYYMAPNFGV